MKILTTLCMAACLVAMQQASAQGPVREGLRRTGEAAVEGTQRVVEGTGQVVRRTGEVAANTAIRTGQAAGNIAGATIDALTPGIPWQARAGVRRVADQGRAAQWRMARHNGEWWYYSPEGQWMYHRDGDWNRFAADSFHPLNQNQNLASANAANQNLADQNLQDQNLQDPNLQDQQLADQQFSGERTAGYRGETAINDQALSQAHPGEQVRHDRCGRPYICVNGQAMYLNEGQQGGEYQQQQYGPPEQPTPDASHSQQQSQGVSAPPQPQGESSAVVGGTTGASTGVDRDPEAPREINNNPNPVSDSGDATTSGRASNEALR